MPVIKPKNIMNKMNHIKYHQINLRTMKRKFLLALTGIAVILASCNKEEVGNADSNSTTKKSFTINVDNGVQTRAKVTDLTRYVMEVYEGTSATGTPEVHKEQATGVFNNVILKDGQTYTVLFWADYGTPSTDGTNPAGNEYNASDLKVARVADGKQATKVAFAGASKFTVGTDNEDVYTAVKLTHAVAQVNFMQNEALTSDVNTLVVKYPESYSLNVDDMSVTKIAGEVSHSFTYSSKEVGTLGTSYIIAATGTTKTVMDITATMTSGGATNSKAVTAIPFECNYRTNIYGAYSNLYNSTLSVTCDTQWETTNKEVTFPVTPQVGNFFYSDKTYSTDLKTNKTVIGIVFWVDPTDPTKGKIISLDESYLVWNQDNITIPGTESKTDGAANTATFTSYSDYLTKFPCVAWCVAKNNPAITGIHWYVPACNELKDLYGTNGAIKDKVNAALGNISGAAMLNNSYYFSSTQSLDYTSTNPYIYIVSLSNGMFLNGVKSNLNNVRAMSAF